MTPSFDLGTPELDRFRSEELSRLDAAGHRYFDYTGSGLYAASQIRRHADRLLTGTFGNPHSYNPTSVPSTELVEEARSRVLAHLGAEADYECVFTANATAALKLVGEAFDFHRRGRLLLSADNHNSVNGVREFARRAGARISIAPLEAPSLRLDLDVTRALLERGEGDGGLFAFPAQSNYSGVQHPLDLVDVARERGWTVLLDAAAFVPTNQLDLSAVPADFVAVSFYKMFGFPTGVGALLARRSALAGLRRPWFAGGTIVLASVVADQHRLSPGHAGFEDGTPDFLSLPAVTDGLELMERIGVPVIHERVSRATATLLGAFTVARRSWRSWDPPCRRCEGPRSPSTCWTPTERCCTTAGCRSSPPREGSRCARGASAIPAPVRRRVATPARRWRSSSHRRLSGTSAPSTSTSGSAQGGERPRCVHPAVGAPTPRISKRWSVSWRASPAAATPIWVHRERRLA